MAKKVPKGEIGEEVPVRKRVLIGIKTRLHRHILEALAKRWETDTTEVANRLIMEAGEKLNLWPPGPSAYREEDE